MRWGRNARTPCTTPQKLTPITHSHDSMPPNHGSPPPATPALLHSTLTCPKRSSVWVASASTCSRLLTSVSTASVSTPVAAIRCSAASSASGLDVGEHERATGGGERVGEREADAARRAGDDRDRCRFPTPSGADPSVRRRYRAARARGRLRGGDPHPRLAFAQGPPPGRAVAAGGRHASGSTSRRPRSGARTRGSGRRSDSRSWRPRRAWRRRRSTRSTAISGRGPRSRCSTARRTGSRDRERGNAFWFFLQASIKFPTKPCPKVGCGA